MNKFWHGIMRINLLAAFAILLGGHLLMYWGLETDNGTMLALTASLVDTGVLFGVQLYAQHKIRAK